MQKNENSFHLWALTCLLAVSPLMNGGKQTWFSLLVALGVAFLVAARFVEGFWRGTPAFVWDRKDGIFLLLLFWCLIALKPLFSPPDALDSFLILVGCLFIFFLARTLSCEGFSVPLALGLSLAGAAYVLAGILQLAGFFPHAWWKPAAFMASTFVNHNHFAAYLEVLLPLSSAVAIAAPLGSFRRFLMLFSSVVMATGLLLTNSRGGWLSILTASVLGMAWWLAGRRKKGIGWNWIRGGGIILSLAGIGFLMVQTPIFDRITTLVEVSDDVSFQTRLVIWRSALPLLKENFLTGHGLDSFVFAYPRFRALGLYRLIDFAHNEYLQIAVELGLVGLVLVILSGLILGRRMTHLVRLSRASWKQALGLGGLIGLGSVALHSTGDFPWRLPAVAFNACAVMGLVTGIQYRGDPDPLRARRFAFADSGTGKTMRWIVTLILVISFIFLSGWFSTLVRADFIAKQAGTAGKIRNHEQAASLYRQAIRGAPFRSRYLKKLGDQLTRLAKQNKGYERKVLFQEAVEAYQAALKLNPYDVWSAYGLGLAFHELGSLEEGERWLSWAVQWDPKNPLFLKDWAEIELILGKVPEAAQTFLKSAQLAQPYHFFPESFSSLDDPAYFIQRGESALLQGHAKYAENLFRTAQAFDPKSPEVQVYLAMGLLNQGKIEKAEELANTLESPELKARWFSELARWNWGQGKPPEVKQAIDAALNLDPANLLARHVQLLLAKTEPTDLSPQEALEALLSLNRPPVFLKRDEFGKSMLVWELENGNYANGNPSKKGWKFSRNGTIAQRMALPPGRVHFELIASGTTAGERGPLLELLWNGRLILLREAKSKEWEKYGVSTKVKAGESLLQVRFVNDFYSPATEEDRNLMIDKIVIHWETA